MMVRELLGYPASVEQEVSRWDVSRQADVFIKLLQRALNTTDKDRLTIEWMLKELTVSFLEAQRSYCVQDPQRGAMGWIGQLDQQQYAQMSALVDAIFAEKRHVSVKD